MLNFENYGNMPIATLTKLEGYLEKVKKFPRLRHDYKLFKGKLLLHKLKSQEALTEFQELTNLDPQKVLMFDGRSRLRETSLVFVAITKMQMGKNAEARRDLEAVVNMQDVTTSTKQWAEQILNNIPE
jgi:predicted RNase H-like nuclease (RuvC/YqgF family)